MACRNYTWVKAIITTENRDRPGGHGQSYATDDLGYNEAHSARGSLFIKRKQRRKQRREQRKIKVAAVREFYTDCLEDYREIAISDLDRDYSDLMSMESEYIDYCDYIDDAVDDPYDPYQYYDDYDYMDDYYSKVDYDRRHPSRMENPHNHVISYEDCGKTLGDILQEIQDKKSNVYE